MTVIPEVLSFEIARLTLAPGDVLVVKLDERDLSHERARHTMEQLKHLVPGGVKTLIIDGKTDLSVLTKAEIEARAQ